MASESVYKRQRLMTNHSRRFEKIEKREKKKHRVRTGERGEEDEGDLNRFKAEEKIRSA